MRHGSGAPGWGDTHVRFRKRASAGYRGVSACSSAPLASASRTAGLEMRGSLNLISYRSCGALPIPSARLPWGRL